MLARREWLTRLVSSISKCIRRAHNMCAALCLTALIFSSVLPSIYGGLARAEIAVESGDLMELIEDIRVHMPGSGDEGFVVPSGTDLDRWRLVSEAMLDNRPEAVDSIITLHFPFYELALYTDYGFEERSYYVLRETSPVVKGWGTFILSTQRQREIAIEVPHARYETNTPSEGIDIYRRTGSLLFIMTGVHRCSNDAYTPCDGASTVCGDGRYHISDAAHCTEAPYQVMHETFTDYYPHGYSFSIHGTGRSECNDIFLSNGRGSDSKPILYELRDHMNASGNILVSVSGDGTSTCTLTGATNVQGRYTNGSPDPCNQYASSNSGYFIHAEQQRRVRDSYAIYSKFINAINDAINPVTASTTTTSTGDDFVDISLLTPNPSGPHVLFSVSTGRARRLTVEVFDVLGRRIALLHRGNTEADGLLRLSFQSDRMASGVYFIKASGGGIFATRKIVILH